jgi:hypothetical protein
MSKRRIKKRKSRRRLAYGLIAVVFIFLCLTFFFQRQSNQTSNEHETPPQVAIVDQLNFTGQSDPTFVNVCEKILNEAGLTWKYYMGADVTVNFYRNLPSYATSLIILRVHSAIMKTSQGIVSILGLFTSELYSAKAAQKYPGDVKDQRLVEAYFNETQYQEGIIYFGIVPSFIEKSMNGKFNNTIIIMMGCQGLGYVNATGARVPYTDMAEAFVSKGAKVYIGWDGPVDVSHTDNATINLLQHLISEKQNIGNAVEKTRQEVGPDPTFNSTLQYYPENVDVENYTIPSVRSSFITNVAYTSLLPEAPTSSKYTAHK